MFKNFRKTTKTERYTLSGYQKENKEEKIKNIRSNNTRQFPQINVRQHIIGPAKLENTKQN